MIVGRLQSYRRSNLPQPSPFTWSTYAVAILDPEPRAMCRANELRSVRIQELVGKGLKRRALMRTAIFIRNQRASVPDDHDLSPIAQGKAARLTLADGGQESGGNGVCWCC
jgi:hypothetical protein